MGEMALIGGLIQKRPDVPEFKKIDAQEQQRTAIEGNASALPAAKKLAGDLNSFNQDQLLGALRKSIPKFDELNKAGAQIVSDFSAPGVPKDIEQLIQRKSAAQALSGGYGGSQAHANLELRDLGLTGLELAGKKLGAIEGWMNFAKQNITAPTMDVTSMFLSPQQQIMHSTSERDKQFNRDWSDSVNKANNAWETILGKEMQNTEAQMMSMVSSVLGSVGGLAAGACWVAREVFGEANPKWLLFRHWLLTKAPAPFVRFYMLTGEKYALYLQKHPKQKRALRIWMEAMIATI